MTHPRQYLLSLISAFLDDLALYGATSPWGGKLKEMMDPIYEALQEVELHLEDVVVDGVAE